MKKHIKTIAKIEVNADTKNTYFIIDSDKYFFFILNPFYIFITLILSRACKINAIIMLIKCKVFQVKK